MREGCAARDHGAVPAPVVRAFHYREFDLPRLVEAKRDTTISVCLPARDEEDTVGEIVELIQHELVERRPLVDEILVIDDRSIDGTAKRAADAGARVVSTEEVLPDVRRPRRQGRRAVAIGVRGRRRHHRLVRRGHPQLRRAVRASASSVRS